MSAAEVSILFIFTSFAAGVVITQVISYFNDAIPYTVVVFIFGALMAFFDYDTKSGLWSNSVGDWSFFNSEILFYFLLPPLILGDAMSLNWYYAVGGIWQSVILAGPGVIVGTVLMGVITKYILPYDWSWNLSMLFGAILSATDPVAVVALLKGCNASPKLTILIIGESLLNDGTAMVLFNLLFNILNGESYSAGDIVVFFVNSCLGSPAFGAAFGLAMVFWMRTSRRKWKEIDAIIQIAITISCGYLIFFIAQYILGQSGVLALCGAGIVIAALAPPIILNQEANHSVWETLGWFMNTILFLLVGLRLGLYIIYFAHAVDYLYTFILYLVLMVIRVVMIAMFYPIISNIGHKCTVKEAIFIAWSGLRGGVAIILALLVGTNTNPSVSSDNDERLFFYVAGIAALTLFINGTLAETMLLRLKLIGDESIAKLAIANQMRRRVRGKMNRSCIEMENKMNISTEESAYMRTRCSILREYDDLKPHHASSQMDLASISKSVSSVFSSFPRIIKHRLSGKGLSPAKSDSADSLDEAHAKVLESLSEQSPSRPTSPRNDANDKKEEEEEEESFGVRRTHSMQVDDYESVPYDEKVDSTTSPKTRTPKARAKLSAIFSGSDLTSDAEEDVREESLDTSSKKQYYAMLRAASTRDVSSRGPRSRSNSSFSDMIGSLKGRIENLLDPLSELKVNLGVTSPASDDGPVDVTAPGATMEDGDGPVNSLSNNNLDRQPTFKTPKKKGTQKKRAKKTAAKPTIANANHDALTLSNPDKMKEAPQSSSTRGRRTSTLYSIVEDKNEVEGEDGERESKSNGGGDIELVLSEAPAVIGQDVATVEVEEDDEDDNKSDNQESEEEEDEEVEEEKEEDGNIWRSRLRSLTQYISQQRRQEEVKAADGKIREISWELVGYYRTIFLSIVRTRYWKDIQQGRLPRYSPTSLFLLYSIDVGLDGAMIPDTQDWTAIQEELDTNKMHTWLLYWIGRTFTSSRILNLLLKQDANRIKTAVYILTSFIAAHEHAQAKLHEYSSVTEDERVDDKNKVSPEEAIVREESIQAVRSSYCWYQFSQRLHFL